jgi:hypothetical protein
MDVKLAVDVLEMKGHGVDGDAHLVRGGFVVVAVDQQLQQFGLLLGQAICGALRRAELAKQVDPRRATPRDMGAPPLAASRRDSGRMGTS